MDCPHCPCTETRRLKRSTDLGYAVFRCRGCGRTFNERTGTPFNFVEVPTEIVFQVLLFRVRYKLSYRDVAEMFLLRGFRFTHETVRDWEERLAPLFTQELRAKRQGKASQVWYVDETYVKVKGRWCYLYRAIDEAGDLIDVRLSEQRDMTAAKAFFEQAREMAGRVPERVISDGHTPYPRAITEVLEPEVEHQLVGCVANPIEPDHRGIKQRYYPTLGFKTVAAAGRFCQIVDEVRQFFRPRRWPGEKVSLAERRALFLERVAEFRGLVVPA